MIDVRYGDSRDMLPTLAEVSIAACVTDPPYSLQTINKRFAKVGRNDKTWSSSGPHQRTARGFMNQKWDTGETAFAPEFWAEVLRVLKPGAHLIAFGGTRTYHRLACAIEDAGFEIRDQIGWCFGSGFPKSHNAGNGWGTALKPAWEPIVLARKPLIGAVASNVQQHGTGALNIDGCRVETGDNLNGGAYSPDRQPSASDWVKHGGTIHSYAGKDYQPPLGRWPANLIHDGSEEVLAAFAAYGESESSDKTRVNRVKTQFGFGDGKPEGRLSSGHSDSGSAARFFYSAKADAADRLQSKHPTVKPVDLMAYLVRLVTPPGGTVLDPFAGSGTTGMACMREGFDCILIEREAAYVADIRRRLHHVCGTDTPLFAPTAC